MKPKLAKLSTAAREELTGKEDAAQAMAADLEILKAQQDRLYAEGRRSLLSFFKPPMRPKKTDDSTRDERSESARLSCAKFPRAEHRGTAPSLTFLATNAIPS